MASKSLVIWNKIIEIISSMRKEDGYHHDVMEVSKKFFDITKLSSFPCVSVLQGGEEKDVLSEDEILYRATRRFFIIGFGQSESDNDDEGIVGERADELAEDLQEVLLNNLDEFADTESEGCGLIIMSVDPMPIEGTNKFFVGIEAKVRYTHENDV